MLIPKRYITRRNSLKRLIFGVIAFGVIAIVGCRIYYTSSMMLEGTVINKTDQTVYLDESTEPIPYAASVQQPNHNDIKIVALTKDEYEKIEVKDQIEFYDDNGVYRFRSIKN